MYIQKKPAAAVSKLLIGTISLCLMWSLVGRFGLNSLRIFPTWVVVIAAIYFLTSALVTALNPKKFTGHIICPMLDGLLLVNCLLMSGFAITSAQHYYYLPELPSVIVWSVCLVLPLLIFLDWLFFVKKGGWKPMYPFYWLAFSICYAAAMIFSAQILPDGADLRYPLEIFNFINFGLGPMFGWMLLVVILVLVIGYILFLLDFAMSGKLAKKIVLPHLQVIEVDEQGNEIKPTESRLNAKNKPVKPQSANETKPTEPQSTAEVKTKASQPQKNSLKSKPTVKSKTTNAQTHHGTSAKKRQEHKSKPYSKPKSSQNNN